VLAGAVPDLNLMTSKRRPQVRLVCMMREVAEHVTLSAKTQHVVARTTKEN